MAKVSPVRSVGGSDNEGTPSPPKTAGKKSKKASEEPMEVDNEDEEEASEDEGEEEYEIEAILDAKRGSFPEGRIGYFVKWKGYDETENSWVDENDAGNADALIKEYWKQTKARQAKTPAKAPAKPRKSAASASASVAEPSTKKRGRKSLPAPASSASARDETDVTEVRAAKKAKKNGTAKAKSDGEEEEAHFTNMAAYMAIPSWEHLVSNVDTIERNIDGTLSIYFKLVDGQLIKEDSKLCAERFPQKVS
ncbi:hypothetical protein DXG03_009627 [Asterophora parasitica]|uniref:Chromo domain-containing protein n=1 Tax=Asterophora parasitica TaxID=117018 RepID=A0A9P7G6H6_9AGAR|nr:hypothetical protein DXG03_009627 [Asterophora parasitica]